jgi:hypothetical protein
MKPPGEPMDRTDVSVAVIVAISTLIVFPILTIGIQFLLSAAAQAIVG